MEFEWDLEKAVSNLAKHGVSFSEVATIFGDPLEMMIGDPDHSEDELRFVSIGVSVGDRLLVVAYNERHGQLRMIRARQATPAERREYESGSKH